MISSQNQTEFYRFLKAHGEAPPETVLANLKTHLAKDNSPSKLKIFIKLALLQLVIGSLSLGTCSQFGIGNHTGWAHSLMSINEQLCFAVCGSYFFAFPSIFSIFILTSFERHQLRTHLYWPLPIVGLATLSLFALLGAEVMTVLSVVWLIAGLVSAVTISEFIYFIKGSRILRA